MGFLAFFASCNLSIFFKNWLMEMNFSCSFEENEEEEKDLLVYQQLNLEFSRTWGNFEFLDPRLCHTPVEGSATQRNVHVHIFFF